MYALAGLSFTFCTIVRNTRWKLLKKIVVGCFQLGAGALTCIGSLLVIERHSYLYNPIKHFQDAFGDIYLIALWLFLSIAAMVCLMGALGFWGTCTGDPCILSTVSRT